MAKDQVSERALIGRINRVLAKDDEKLRRARVYRDSNGWEHEDSNVGRYYTVDLRYNAIVHTKLDLEAYAREKGVLGGREELARE